MELLEGNLSEELILTLITGEDRDHIILTSGYKNTLSASNSGDFTSMSFQNKTEILLLIPNVDSTVGTSRVADTILVKWGTVELSLGVLLTESTILEKLLGSISWVPELDGSCGDSNEFQIIWFLGPLDVEDRISSCWEGEEHLLSLYVIDVHVVVVALVNACNVSLAWTDW